MSHFTTMGTLETSVDSSIALLKYSFGIVLILIGLDKVLGTDLIVNWEGYVSGLALAALPFEAGTIVLLLGIAEIIVGIIMATKWPRIAAYIAIATLAVIIIDLFSMGLYDIAARDLLLAVALLTLARLSAARE